MNNIFKKYISKEITQNPYKNNTCDKYEVDNWLISDFIVKRLIPVVGVRPFPIEEILFLINTVLKHKPTHIFEWGTNVGKSARIFHEISKNFGLRFVIHSIDLPDNIAHSEHPKNKRGVLVKNMSGVNLHIGDGLTTALDLYDKITTKIRPLFFLDGDHSYESVKRELESITKNVKNPIIIIHDTFFQSSESGYNIGPYRAVQYILKKYPSKYKFNATTSGLPGITLLHTKNAKKI